MPPAPALRRRHSIGAHVLELLLQLQRQIEEVMLQLPERSGAFAVSNRDNIEERERHARFGLTRGGSKWRGR